MWPCTTTGAYVEGSYFQRRPVRLHKLKDRVQHLIVFGETSGHLISDLQRHIAGPASGGVEMSDNPVLTIPSVQCQIETNRRAGSCACKYSPETAQFREFDWTGGFRLDWGIVARSKNRTNNWFGPLGMIC